MKKYNIFVLIVAACMAMGLGACSDILDRPNIDTPNDNSFWRNETDVRLFANGFITNYFIGYGVGWSPYYSYLRGYTFSDDVANLGQQRSFEDQVPATRESISEDVYALDDYSGPTWNFAWVRKANLFLKRLERMQQSGALSGEPLQHWTAVAKFYKAFAYARLVEVFGDVPYYPNYVESNDLDALYKDRDARELVMDSVYNLSKTVLATMRTSDGENTLNRYVAAGFISRWFLFEGTWQKYHKNDTERAKKYLQLAQDAAQMIINTGKYRIDAPVRELFGSQNLNGNKECLLYQHFDATTGVTHCIAAWSNGIETTTGVNLDFLKSVICADGKPYTRSEVAGSDSLNLSNLLRSRDPRFEACFVDRLVTTSSTLMCSDKFIDRLALTLPTAELQKHPEYISNTNTNDAPVMRYGEVLLNWIEAKAELATLGGPAVSQADIDLSINALRDRPLDATAKAKGLKNTAHMMLSDITADFDPNRDQTVDPLLWEIRRERRLEMLFEHSRLLDLKRWHKLEYMDNDKHPDTMVGPWVDFSKELPASLKAGSTQVRKADGTVVTYNGSNAADMVGYYLPTGAKPRNSFTDRVYMAPVGLQQIQAYKQRGKTLTQTKGW